MTLELKQWAMGATAELEPTNRATAGAVGHQQGAEWLTLLRAGPSSGPGPSPCMLEPRR